MHLRMGPPRLGKSSLNPEHLIRECLIKDWPIKECLRALQGIAL